MPGFRVPKYCNCLLEIEKAFFIISYLLLFFFTKESSSQDAYQTRLIWVRSLKLNGPYFMGYYQSELIIIVFRSEWKALNQSHSTNWKKETPVNMEDFYASQKWWLFFYSIACDILQLNGRPSSLFPWLHILTYISSGRLTRKHWVFPFGSAATQKPHTRNDYDYQYGEQIHSFLWLRLSFLFSSETMIGKKTYALDML